MNRVTETATMTETRTETDSLGSIDIEAARYWGPQTERARRLFNIGSEKFPPGLIRAVGLQKQAAAEANRRLGELPGEIADPIITAAREITEGKMNAVPLARLADGIRHPDQHECQRGHRQSRQRDVGSAAWQQAADPSERSRQPRPVL
jgi:hypothetical protein